MDGLVIFNSIVFLIFLIENNIELKVVEYKSKHFNVSSLILFNFYVMYIELVTIFSMLQKCVEIKRTACAKKMFVKLFLGKDFLCVSRKILLSERYQI